MKKKIWMGGIGFVLILSIMIFLDFQKVKKEGKPPLPTVRVGKEIIDASLKSYSWKGNNGTEKESKDHSLPAVDPLAELTVTFKKGEEPDHIIIQTPQTNPPEVYREPVESNQYTLPNYPGSHTLEIIAEWKGKGKAKYIAELVIKEKVSYQRLLASEKGFYSLFVLEPVGSQSSLEIPPHIGLNINRMVGTDDLENTQEQYPELEIKSAPTFVLFDHEKVVLKTEKHEELIQFLQSHTGPSYKDLLPKSKEGLSVFAVLESSDDNLFKELSYEEKYPHVGPVNGITDLETVRMVYPDLNIEQIPTYIVFNYKGEVYRSHDSKDVLQFLKSRAPVK
ncbi:hypothetical protein C0966_00115 [Bacillus methanolicus]|uniref:hypothetical protein n=1 Tax=Bacillus methanolicus TaxID=1471 RepID=UPI00238099AB|nr:hypothetical protein [Bacillus methanolicus]MDE3837812.1 hypothetical protein [Bacillus methanolicus]